MITLQGRGCGSDIRRRAKLQGRPQQWNCRRLIDRLLETTAVQIASHFHAPTPRALHQGEGGRDVCECVWVGMLLRGVCRPTREVDVTLTVIYTHTHTHIYIYLRMKTCARLQSEDVFLAQSHTVSHIRPRMLENRRSGATLHLKVKNKICAWLREVAFAVPDTL